MPHRISPEEPGARTQREIKKKKRGLEVVPRYKKHVYIKNKVCVWISVVNLLAHILMQN